MQTPLHAPQVLPPLAQPGPDDVHVGRGILGTCLISVYHPGTEVPLIVVEVDPRIMSEELVGQVWRYVADRCPVTEPEPPKPPLALMK